MELLTGRLVLRDFLPGDWPAVFAYQSLPAYLEHHGQPAPSSDDVRLFVEMLHGWAQEVPRTKYQLAITLGGAVIGTCGVRKETPEGEEAEWGCELAPAYWGHGYAREASRAILTFGFETLRLRRIWARTSPANDRAMRLAEGLGFRRLSPGLYEATGQRSRGV
ncbi:GNAT family N-acetyltransferase [Archangium violaceum]|uniref:GNAT family N-acetyltransferase n=1 Tax=Archangium violaceum TaxID=83451 RepID=UPI00193C2543|nr:GNAT family N-acetyltransferase [Archangium violaceum]QRK04950.1 GNAT family N-acetyltransferase [Archangium violaceum]